MDILRGTMYLLDSNVWLENLLEQERAEEVKVLLERTLPNALYITEFSLGSIGVILIRQGLSSVLAHFLDSLIEGEVNIIRLSPEDMKDVITACRDFNLDFDDGYQYVAARKRGLTLVTFDRNFTRTDIERVSPSQLV